MRYCLQLTRATRPASDGGHADIAPLLRFGAGPRASQSLVLGAKARATLNGRSHVGLEDVRAVAPAVLRHRIQPSYEADARGMTADNIIAEVLLRIEQPKSDIENDASTADVLK